MIMAGPRRANPRQRSREAALGYWLRSRPVDRPRNWLAAVNRPLASEDLQHIRQALARGVPPGADQWNVRMVRRLGLQATLRPRERLSNKPMQSCRLPLVGRTGKLG